MEIMDKITTTSTSTSTTSTSKSITILIPTMTSTTITLITSTSVTTATSTILATTTATSTMLTSTTKTITTITSTTLTITNTTSTIMITTKTLTAITTLDTKTPLGLSMISILIANIINFKIIVIVTHMVRTVRTSLNISPILFHQIRPTHRAAPVVGKDPRLVGAAPGDGHLDATSPAVLKTAELPTGNSELILTFAAPRSSGVNTWVAKRFVHKEHGHGHCCRKKWTWECGEHCAFEQCKQDLMLEWCCPVLNIEKLNEVEKTDLPNIASRFVRHQLHTSAMPRRCDAWCSSHVQVCPQLLVDL
eukprot:symbB.v1.2.005773.t1/scaffold289.1/size287290/18